MTLLEFSDQFDVLLNSYSTSVKTITLNEYEKSVYLTKAYRELVTRYYNGLNSKGEAFENSEEARRNLQHLVKTENFENLTGSSPEPDYYFPPLNFDKVAYIVMESAKIKPSTGDNTCYGDDGKDVDVIPVTHDDFLRIRRNPFKGPSSNRVLRLNEDNKIKLEPAKDFDILFYEVTYIEKPSPIILIDLPDELTIDGISTATDNDELDEYEIIHKDILELAVKLALIDRQVKETKTE